MRGEGWEGRSGEVGVMMVKKKKDGV